MPQQTPRPRECSLPSPSPAPDTHAPTSCLWTCLTRTCHVNGVTHHVALCVQRPSRVSCVQGLFTLWQVPAPPRFHGRVTLLRGGWAASRFSIIHRGTSGPLLPLSRATCAAVNTRFARSLGHTCSVLRGTDLGAELLNRVGIPRWTL